MRVALNKNSLKQQRDQLAMYRRFLPSLDLKRRQLLGAYKQAVAEQSSAESQLDQFQATLSQLLPLLGSTTVDYRTLRGLVQVESVQWNEENVVGVRVPIVGDVVFTRRAYSTLTLPFWVDELVAQLEQRARLELRLQALRQRVEALGAASRKVTQRVNLFEKVLIPRAETNIKKIGVALTDEERASVVRSKLSKRKHGPAWSS